jgi:23S rRNA (cytidine1920-2'-O)/16S rRNA (cytidine1409-2'-O)-methyltransferase
VLRLDRTNIHTLVPADLPTLPDVAVIDASFASLQRILPHVTGLIRPCGRLLALVKPQFEVARHAVGKGGIVHEPKRYQEVISALITTAHRLGLHVIGIMESPLRGARGNREFFLYCRKNG